MGHAGGAIRVRIAAIDAFERRSALRLPFRFGGATLREAPQAFARVVAEDVAGRRAEGWAADAMMPRWFDKDPARSEAENVEGLRNSVRDAIAIALAPHPPRTPLEHVCTWRHAARDLAATRANPLLAGFGRALVERALLDAVCRIARLSFADALRAGALGAAPPHARRVLETLHLPARIAMRHTIGILDALRATEVGERPPDDLPVALEEVIDRYRPRWFKIKLSGDVHADLVRLRAIAVVLGERIADYGVTLDCNERMDSVEKAIDLCDAIEADPSLARLRRGIAYLEQPLHRDVALGVDVRSLARFAPVVIDESDGDDDAFVRARECGYTGVSVKSCKGVLRAVRNRIRCAEWNVGGGAYFLAGEDLTCQAGLAVQQDLALAALLGVEHVERNGHHYAGGLQGASAEEVAAFAAAHADLYERVGGSLRLRIEAGEIALGSLGCVGFASDAHPDPAALHPLEGS